MKAGSTPYTIVGSPEPDSGIRILDPKEIMDKLSNPKFREAINRMEKNDFNGQPSGVKIMVQRQAREDLVMRQRVKNSMDAIDIAKRKKDGTY